ncbi:hypothetical protein CP10743SC13_1737A, partial [Chlamydia psittaci 10_743_SC13]|jgi:hypothetical protein
MEDS